jgi:diaminopimelate decarboxylase
MRYFNYKDDELYVENISAKLIAERFGTPCYVYSRASIESNWLQFHQQFGDRLHQICYAVKANSNIAILNVLAKLGSGFDIVSTGELERVIAAGGDPKKVIFSGVGKTKAELVHALKIGIYCFNLESEAELQQLNLLAKTHDVIAKVALRVNPNIDSGSHPYISTGLKENKFGIEIDNALVLADSMHLYEHIQLIGIGCHIGSQLTSLSPLLDAIDIVLKLIEKLTEKNINLEFINVGGGLGVQYDAENPPSIADYVKAVCDKLKNVNLNILLEPGRAIVANAGILLTTVEYLKHTPFKNFAIVDAGLNDLLRPALYNAWQKIIPVKQTVLASTHLYDIVGPVCESADFMGKDRLLNLHQHDLLAICDAGAYGFSMSSNYNSRPRAAEVLVDQDQTHLIRPRETVHELFATEKIPI